MMAVKVTILLLINIIFHFTKASLFGDVPLLCKIKNPVVPLTPLDLADVTSFVESQRGFMEEFQKGLYTQVKNTEKAFFEAEENSEDLDLNVIELIEKYGYKAETHEVTTADGYGLTIHRIPGNGTAVLLMHVLIGSADDWVSTENNGLAFLLASQGYDVWLGNNRGNKHSQKHTSLSPECADYWDFSWDENGRLDLPVIIDYILETTGKSQIAFVGFSQGNTQFLVLGSELPEYNEKISVAVLLGPFAYASHVRSTLFRLLALTENLAYKLLGFLGVNSFTSNEIANRAVTRLLCGNNALSQSLCSSFLPLIGGYDLGQFDIKHLPSILNHYPAGGSVKQLQHYAQLINSARFCRFDYGKKKNLEVYDSETPPDYVVENVSAPVVLFYGGNDYNGNVTDVKRLMARLPNVAGTEYIETYGHYSFIWAENAKELVFKPLIEYIKKYE